MAKPTPAPFEFSELLPLGADNTQYRFLGSEGVSTFETSEGTFLKVDPAAIILLTEHAMRDIAHLLRAVVGPLGVVDASLSVVAECAPTTEMLVRSAM